ncbi:MAG: hypothetical protein K2N38_05285 [Oscillospiraceae bacterium]|nr:hypothetical protein [Oscillospiraceae bacterium]
MKIDPIDVLCSIFILAGVIFLIVSTVHRHKGMWNLRNSYEERWDSANPKVPRYQRRGAETPYDEIQIGISLIAVGLLGFVYSAWGLKVCAAAVTAVSIASLVFNGVRLKRLDGGHELRTWCIVNLIISGFALFFGSLTFYLA